MFTILQYFFDLPCYGIKTKIVRQKYPHSFEIIMRLKMGLKPNFLISFLLIF